jgi:hypothetical protein
VSVDTLSRAAAPKRSPVKKKRRKRFRFSLNGLAIQLSAFALSFTLVALLVVSGSQQAFVEQNEVVTQYVPIGTPTPTDGGGRRAGGTRAPAGTPTASDVPVSDSPAVTEPTPEPTAEPTTEPVTQPAAVTEAPAPLVRLTDSAAGTALFGNDTVRPGVTVERCITVTYGGNVDPGTVRLYAAPTSGDLAPYLDLTIDIGQRGVTASASCTGFTGSSTLFAGTLAGFASAHSSYATGRTTWNPGAGQATRSFRFSLTLRHDPAAAGKSATFGFSWRAEVP